MTYIPSYIVISIVLVGAIASAQGTREHVTIDLTNLPGLMVGHEVYVKTDTRGGLRGRVTELAPDALVLNQDKQDVQIRAAEIGMIERINPRSSGRAIFGGIFGGVAGLLVGSLTAYAVADLIPDPAQYAILAAGPIVGATAGFKIAGSSNTVVYLRPAESKPSSSAPLDGVTLAVP